MSFGLARQSNKDKFKVGKTSPPAKPSPTRDHHRLNNLAMDPADDIIHLQRTIGNQALQRLMGTSIRFDFAKIDIRPKSEMSQSGDAHEDEADRVAKLVTRMPVHDTVTPITAVKEEGMNHGFEFGGSGRPTRNAQEPDGEQKGLQANRVEATNTGKFAAPPIVHEVVSSPGQPLDPATRDVMEPRFGYDFSHVRMHTDTKAAESARAVNALAYTVGRDIVFGSGRYSPTGFEGQELLAH
jgi:Domain of unknown function (DUF4157)